MALVNDVKKEIHAKIVYYGPAKAGKTTNLEFIYNKLKPEYRGKFKFLNTSSGKMVFFDFMRPELAGVKDYSIHFHIYTVPGVLLTMRFGKMSSRVSTGLFLLRTWIPQGCWKTAEALMILRMLLLFTVRDWRISLAFFSLTKRISLAQ